MVLAGTSGLLQAFLAGWRALDLGQAGGAGSWDSVTPAPPMCFLRSPVAAVAREALLSFLRLLLPVSHQLDLLAGHRARSQPTGGCKCHRSSSCSFPMLFFPEETLVYKVQNLQWMADFSGNITLTWTRPKKMPVGSCVYSIYYR